MSLFTRIGCRNVFGFRQFAGSQKRKCQGFSWMQNAPLEERLLLTAQLSKIRLAADEPSDVTTTDITVISHVPVDYMSQLKSKALAVLTTDTLPQSFYTRTVQALLSGRMTQAEANLRLVRTQTARDVITQGLYQALFNTSPTAMQIKPYISGPLQNAGMRQRLFHMAAGDAYYQYSGSNAEAYRLAVAGVFLGQPSLPPSYAKMPVATVNQRRALLNQLTKTSEFRTTWTVQLAKVANNSGTFTADQLRQASTGFQAVLGFERTLARLLTYPVSKADVVNRVQNVPVNAGQPLNNVWQTNRHWLVPERTTSTAPNAGMQSAANGTSTTTTSLSDANLVIPSGSNWGDRVAFPGVSYNAIMAATQSKPAVVPVLSLPTGVISGANLSSGVSIAMWVQAQGPGMLLSADYSVATGSNLTVPYLWINQSGQVEGGLYGPGNISATANQTILSSAGVLGNTEIGSPLSISSQTGIIDNTWHQVAFVANQTSQALYVDGILQGTSTSAAYLQNASGLTTSSSSNNITLSLDQQTANGSAFTTQVFQNGACSYLLSGTANSSGIANLTVTPGTNQPSIFTVVSSATLNNGTTLTLTMENSVGSTDAVGLAASYQTISGTKFSLTPSFANGSGYTLGQLQAVNTGGSIFSLATGNLAPNTNYPQPFIGAVDELGLWGTTITQAEVQAVMTVPSNLTEKVTLPSGKSISNVTEPTYYFNFNGNATQTTFTSQSPATNTTATATASGLITGVAATIPTAPFGNITRLPGYQDFGIGLMTPLATGSLDLGSTSTSGNTTVQFSLAVSDQLALSIPAASQGNLTVLLYDDQNAQVTTSLAAGKQYYIVANRTGSYKMELQWSPNVSGTDVNLNYYMVPGALNSLPELFTSYQPDVSSPSDIVYAYADPTLPTINNSSNNDVGFANATGPANYFPLWSDSHYFPTSANYTSADLSQAYSLLVANLTIQNTGLNDFCNINLGGTVDNPARIQNYLATAYQDATGASSVPAPPTTTSGLYPVAPAGSAVDAVYEFLYNTNVMRENIYTAIVGGGSDNNNLSSWLQSVYDLANASDIPSDIANEIFSGQANQVTGETVPIQTVKGSSTPIWETAVTYAIGEGLALAAAEAFGPIGYGLVEGAMYLCLGFESLGNSGPSVSPAYVSFTPVINAILNYASLNELAKSIVSGQATPFRNYASTVTSTAYLQSIFSNYGLLTAMSAMTGTALGDTNTMNYSTALNSPMTQTSWQSMIPATFTWQPVPSYGFPSGNMGTGSYNPTVVTANTTSYGAKGVAAIATADFNNDGVPDAVLSNNDSSTVSVMLGNASDPVPSYNQAVSFSSSSGTTLDTDGFTQCSGIAAGDFNNDGFQDILVNSYNLSESALAFGNGTGSFSSFTGINLAGGTSPQDIVVADFNQDGWQDYATAAYGSSTIVVGINTTGGNTSTSYSAIGSHSTSISTGFNSSTYTASFTTYNINTEGATGGATLDVGDFNNDNYSDIILSGAGSSTMGLLMNAGFANSTWNGFDKAQNLGLNGLDQIGSLAVGDYNGDGYQDVILQGSYGTITMKTPNGPAVPTSMGGNGIAVGLDAYWFFKGSGTANATSSGFATPQWMGMNTFDDADLTTIPASLMGGGVQDGLAISLQTQVLVVYNPITEMNQYQANPSGYFYGEVISNENVTAVDLKTLPGGCTGYYVPVNTSYVDNTAITIASNGMILVGYDGKNSSVLTSQLGYSQNSLVNTLSTFAPGQDASTSLLNLSGSVTATNYLGDLQGGFVTTIPNYFPDAMAYVAGTTNLVVNTQIASPGFFLSWSPATVSGTLNGKNQTTLGGIVTGWNLVDSNGNPIALGTLNSLFGAPTPYSTNMPAILPNLWQGTTPTPVNASNPVSAYNGGWYFNSKPVNSAPTTWAGAFFDWGTNVAGFSPGTLVPANVTGVQIPGANSTYNITYSAATSAPPSASSFTANSISTASVAAAPSKLTRISQK
jgi:hypothetical protein